MLRIRNMSALKHQHHEVVIGNPSNAWKIVTHRVFKNMKGCVGYDNLAWRNGLNSVQAERKRSEGQQLLRGTNVAMYKLPPTGS